jgi:lipoate-protein ligase A
MISKLLVYKTDCVDPYYNIATEKRLLETVEPGCCILYLWQNQNTVVIGRNQNAWVECRTSLLEEEGGHLTRRLSGGGAVFHDLGNLNFTFIMCQEDYDLDKQLSVIREAGLMAGIAVERSGRNDLLAQGCKFSGNAFYHAGGKAYHHGTLLVNANMEKLGRYLTPSKAKLEAKGVQSVRSRVINLKDLCPSLSCAVLGQYMASAFQKIYGMPTEKLQLTDTDTAAIASSAKALESWDWLYGQKLPFSVSFENRYAWGGILLELNVENGTIDTLQVYSDAMDWQLPNAITKALTGCRFTKADMFAAMQTIPSEEQVKQDLCQLIHQQDL